MRVLLYENLDHASQGFSASHLISAGNSVQEAEQFAPIVQNVQRDPREYSAVVHWGSGEDETLNAFPLTGENKQLLGILLVGSSRQIYNELRGQIRSAALLASGAGLLLAVLLSSWVAARVTRPVEELAHAARQVAAGDWHTQVIASSHDEIGELAGSFNRMTHDLVEQRERLLQAERVAAWRELARRLAHELKNPLFPLQLTVENLLRSREQEPSQFEETFRESAATLLTEIANLKNIIGRFSEFSQMPQPRFQEIQLDELVASVAKLHQAQFTKANVQCLTQLSGTLGPPPSSGPADPPSRIAADPDLLRRALSNLVLNAVDAMPQGGTLTLKTIYTQSSARIEVSDTGSGLGQEECARLFTPYYTSKLHGSGLGLAIVQSIVSDHHGTINVNSEPGEGTTFTIELPDNREHLSAAHDMHV
jgi:nitrogen fixation/metabolism regulation signal transduction histidine kinase